MVDVMFHNHFKTNKHLRGQPRAETFLACVNQLWKHRAAEAEPRYQPVGAIFHVARAGLP